jgi:hypothetical protein
MRLLHHGLHSGITNSHPPLGVVFGEDRWLLAIGYRLLRSWGSHVDLHHDPSPSHGEMQHAYTLGAQTNADCGTWNAEFSAAGPRRSFRAPRFAFRAGDGVRGRTRTG